ncbi:MAG: hypothetical protein AB8F94_10915 [Saprospiraceae bacterium]
MKNSILFPFQYQHDNRQRYIETLEMAVKADAKVVLFTSIPESASEEELDNVYLHLLELNGHFQTSTGTWGENKIATERVITRGDMSVNLVAYLEKKEKTPTIIARPKYPELSKRSLNILLEKLSIPPHQIVE